MSPNDEPPPTLILEPELNALTTSLKVAIVKTGQIYSFYADRARLNHSYNPPDSLTASLGREIEKYDQLCDAIDSHLLRAIAVLQRDLRREEQRKKEAAMATNKGKGSDLLRTADAVHEAIPSGDRVSTPATLMLSPATIPAGRRPSAISISSLQRPAAPLKLDLSSTSLRISEDPALFTGGLASPVTLAPKSARPQGSNEFPPELMAAFASATSTTNALGGTGEIDLTAEDNDSHLPMSLDPAAGSSADKPIELDLDTMDIMSDLFGDSEGRDESTSSKTAIDPGGLFSTHKALSDGSDAQSNVKIQKDGNFLSTFTGDASTMFPRDAAKASTGQHGLANFSHSVQLGGDNGPATNLNTGTIASGNSFDIGSLYLSFSNNGDADVPFSMDDFLSMGGEGKDGMANVS
ncbi:hypothetical protein APHAL10511_006191 [Amanita phalloides]|nr:hypothetical protein APHAL10511_006191 [Amanita phalloides]